MGCATPSGSGGSRRPAPGVYDPRLEFCDPCRGRQPFGLGSVSTLEGWQIHSPAVEDPGFVGVPA